MTDALQGRCKEVVMPDHDPLTLKLSLREKLAYGAGDIGSNLMLSIGTLYLLKFYTDELGMPAYYGGVIFLIAKILYCIYRYANRISSRFSKTLESEGNLDLSFCMQQYHQQLLRQFSLLLQHLVCR